MPFPHIRMLVTLTALILTGCAAGQPQTMTPLEIQSLQTREYESTAKIVFGSVMSVFQDLGYTIRSVDSQAGFINAESATRDTTGTGSGAEILGDFLAGVLRTEQISATAFIEEIGNRTRVRLNFVTTKQGSSAYGQNTRADTPITDAQIYTNAFERIENAIFIRSAE